MANPDGPGPGYSVEEFRIRGSDAKGNYESRTTRFLPAQVFQVINVLASKRFPYREQGDVLRHALYRHLHWLDTLEVIPSITRQVDAMIEVLRQEEFQQDFINVFEDVKRVIANYTASGANGEARRVLASIINHVDGMPAGYWQDRYRRELQEKFGHLMDGGETKSLVERSEEA